MRTALLVSLLTAVFARAADCPLPPSSAGRPTPGKRVAVTPPEYAGTQVHHLITLPDDWSADWQARGKRWPVIAEYTGNLHPASGSTGEVEGAGLGYGVARGRAIWLVLPYIAKDHRKNEVTWWGDIEATAGYAKANLPRVCAEYGGDAKKVVLCGFSRGAIGVSFIGLHDDEIARLWCGFWAHDHFDGVSEWSPPWGAPLARYRAEASVRISRLAARPLLISQGHPSDDTRRFVETIATRNVEYLTVDMGGLYGKFPNDAVKHPHNDRWPLRDGEAGAFARAWFERVAGMEKTAK